MTVEQILAEFEDEMSSEDVSALKDQVRKGSENTNIVYVRAYAPTGDSTQPCRPTHGILGGLEASPIQS